MVTLTDMQSKVLEFIFRHIRDAGVPPTLREIAAHFEWKAVGSAQDVVAALKKKGLLAQNETGKSRQLLPTNEAEKFLNIKAHPKHSTLGATASRATKNSLLQRNADLGVAYIPILGLVQAGNPIESIETADKHIPFPIKETKTEQRFFSLLIDGYSMLNAGFLPGDYVLVEPTNEARNNDIVVASLKEQVTVKRFAMRGSQLYRQAFDQVKQGSEQESQGGLPPAILVPENPDFEPIPFGLDESDRIVGVVRSLFRKEIV